MPAVATTGLKARFERGNLAAAMKIGRMFFIAVGVLAASLAVGIVRLGGQGAGSACVGVMTKVGGDGSRRCLKPGDTFADCLACPKMAVLAAGSFAMGAAPEDRDAAADERPQHTVRIGAMFAVGVFEVTRAQFAAYAADDRGYRPDWCWVKTEGGTWDDRADVSFADPGFAQDPDHPAVCLSWYDAKAYVAWLARKTGHPYRLLGEAEWEYAARAGLSAADAAIEANCPAANGAPREGRPGEQAGCEDGFAFTAPVGSFAANPFGLHDMIGNAAEWVEDCYHPTYEGAPQDAIPWSFGGCEGGKVLRGGSWNDGTANLRTAGRVEVVAGDRYSLTGLRVARSLFPG